MAESNSMLALSSLLSSNDEAEGQLGSKQPSKMLTPATMVLENPIAKQPVPSSEQNSSVTDQSKESIWEGDKVLTKEEIALSQPRDSSQKRPEYDILYKQMVGAEDVYLGMGDATPSSTSCTHIVIKISLPGEKHSDLDLDVKKQSLILNSPNYHLATYLPRPVDHNEGSAKWDSKTSTLSITLPWLE